VPLAPGQGIALLALEEARDRLVQRLFVIGGVERLGDGMPFGVPDILRDLVSQSALAEAGQPPAQGFETARGVGILGAEGVDVAEEALVDQGREPVELEQRVLQGRRRQQQLAAVLRGPADALAHLVAGTVGVAKLVGLVDDHQVPVLRLQLFAHAVGEVEGQDDDARTLQGIPAGPAGFPPAQRVENHRRQVELLLQFELPLLAEGRWTDHQQSALPLGPELAENDAGLDGLAQPDFVGQEHALRQRRLQGKQRGLDLVGVQVDGSVEERHGQAIHAVGRPAGQVIGEIAGVMGRLPHLAPVLRNRNPGPCPPAPTPILRAPPTRPYPPPAVGPISTKGAQK